MVEVVIQAEGPQAEKALGVAAAFFEREFDVKAKTEIVELEGVRKGIDPNWVAVFIAIPGAIVALIQLDERLKLIERTETMLSEMRATLGKTAGVIRIGAKHKFDIATVKAREIIDAIREAKQDDEPGSGGAG